MKRIFGMGLLLTLVGCGGAATEKPYARSFNFADEDQPRPTRTLGSLWSPESGVNQGPEDNRASRVGDLVVIQVEEQASATGDTSSRSQKKVTNQANIDAFLGVINKLKQGTKGILGNDAEATRDLINLSAESVFDATGEEGRTNQVSATVSATVKKVSRNGSLLFVEGRRRITLNEGAHVFYISGVVRKYDINSGNRISSKEMADVEIQYTAEGGAYDAAKRGWLTRFLDWANPF